MSISAEIVGAKANDDGTVTLHLGPWKDEGPGQPQLTVENPPPNKIAFMQSVIGQQIWGGAGEIMVGETKWAERTAYTTIRLCTPMPKDTPFTVSIGTNCDECGSKGFVVDRGYERICGGCGGTGYVPS